MGDWRRVLHEHGPQKATCRPDAPTLPDGNASSAHWTARITDRNTISRKCRTGQCATSHVLANICKRFDCMYLRFPIVSACFPHAPPGFLERGARRPIWVGRIQGQFCLQRPLSVVRCRRWQRPITMGRPSRILGRTTPHGLASASCGAVSSAAIRGNGGGVEEDRPPLEEGVAVSRRGWEPAPMVTPLLPVFQCACSLASVIHGMSRSAACSIARRDARRMTAS